VSLKAQGEGGRVGWREGGREGGRDSPVVPPWPGACLLLEESRERATADPTHQTHQKRGRDGGREGEREGRTCGTTLARGLSAARGIQSASHRRPKPPRNKKGRGEGREGGREGGRNAPAERPWPAAYLLLEESREPATTGRARRRREKYLPRRYVELGQEMRGRPGGHLREGGREGGRGETISRGGREGGKKGLRT